MHPRLHELDALLAASRRELLAAVAAVPADRHAHRTQADGWSVAEVLDHLHRVEAGTAALLARRVMRAREAGVGADPETASVLDRLDFADIADSPIRRTAPEIVRPASDADATASLVRLAESRAALADVVASLDEVDGTQVKATHALLGELDAYQWLLFVAQHERRHARQIAQLGAALADA